MSHGSKKGVFKAMVGNGVIAVGKGIAAAFSGSGAMWAETVHSVVDTVNQGLLYIGRQRAGKEPTDRYPYGYAIEANFWGLLAAIGILVFGGGLTTYHGIKGILEPHAPTHLWMVLGILAFAFAIELYVLWSVVGNMIRSRDGLSWSEHFREQPPGTVTVLLEDIAAALGCIIAAVAVVWSHLGESGLPDAVAQLVIGAMLAAVGLYLIQRNWGVLIGKAIPKEEEDALRAFIEDLHGIDHVEHIVTRRLAPHAFTVTAQVVFSGKDIARDVAPEYASQANSTGADGELAPVFESFADRLFVEQARWVDKLERKIAVAFPDAAHIAIEPHLRDTSRTADSDLGKETADQETS